MVLEDVTELYVFFGARHHIRISFAADLACSDYSGSNTKLPKILLNGNNICMVIAIYPAKHFELTRYQLIPGGEGPEAAAS